jgi:ankyrin repeat protein
MRKNEKLLFEAVELNNAGKIEELIKLGVDVNVRNSSEQTPLHLTTQENGVLVTKLLLDAIADLRERDNWKSNPAEWSTIDLLEPVNLLIAAGANVDPQDNYGQTPLHYAAWNNRWGHAELLIESGADINAKDFELETPLHKTASNDSFDVAQILIDAGADLDVQDNVGWTALHTAVDWDNLEIAELLIDAGADVDVRDNDGRTALQLVNDDPDTYKTLKNMMRSSKTKIKA